MGFVAFRGKYVDRLIGGDDVGEDLGSEFGWEFLVQQGVLCAVFMVAVDIGLKFSFQLAGEWKSLASSQRLC